MGWRTEGLAMGWGTRGVLSWILWTSFIPVAATAQDVVVFVSDRDGDREIYAMRSDGSRPVNLSQHEGRDQAPALSPDRKRVAWISDRSGEIAVWLMAIDGSGKEMVRVLPDADFGLAWSPRGQELAVTLQTGVGGTHDLALLELGSGHLRRLTNTPAEEEITPSWSTNGEHLYYVAGSGSTTSLMHYDLVTGSRTEIASGLPNAGFPVVSPDGMKVLVRSRTDQFDVLRIDPETGAIENLTQHPSNDWGAVWSPDGQRVFFASDRDGDMEIYALDLRSGHLEQLTDNHARDWMPTS